MGFNFTSFNFKNLCNAVVKIPDDDIKMLKHVGDTVVTYNCAFVGCNKKTVK